MVSRVVLLDVHELFCKNDPTVHGHDFPIVYYQWIFILFFHGGIFKGISCHEKILPEIMVCRTISSVF